MDVAAAFIIAFGIYLAADHIIVGFRNEWRMARNEAKEERGKR